MAEQQTPDQNAELQKKLEELTPEQAEMFVRALDLAIRKRRMMLLGYVTALVALIAGLIVALYIYGSQERGSFVGWVFLIPAVGAATCLILFGKLAKRLGK